MIEFMKLWELPIIEKIVSEIEHAQDLYCHLITRRDDCAKKSGSHFESLKSAWARISNRASNMESVAKNCEPMHEELFSVTADGTISKN